MMHLDTVSITFCCDDIDLSNTQFPQAHDSYI